MVQTQMLFGPGTLRFQGDAQRVAQFAHIALHRLHLARVQLALVCQLLPQ